MVDNKWQLQIRMQFKNFEKPRETSNWEESRDSMMHHHWRVSRREWKKMKNYEGENGRRTGLARSRKLDQGKATKFEVGDPPQYPFKQQQQRKKKKHFSLHFFDTYRTSTTCFQIKQLFLFIFLVTE